MPSPSASNTPLRATTLREETFRALRHAILTGRLAPGARLTETELAASLGVSRNPVREALAKLEEQGLVESVPNQGTRVVQPTPSQLQDALLVRAQLELLAVRLVMRKADRSGLERLAEIVNRMTSLAQETGPSDADAVSRMALLDAEFHEGLVACSGNESLRRTWSAAALVDLIFAHDIALTRGRGADWARHIGDTAELHERLLSALCSGDPAQAEAAIKAHFTEPLLGRVASVNAESLAVLGW